jgi:2-oxoglutarate dehydrogenase E2 component (dihydrolipoamide succinyltransferase)
MEYATVVRWHRREGDRVSAGEPLVELEVEKANVDVPSPVSGTVASILAEEGDEIKVGALLATLEES